MGRTSIRLGGIDLQSTVMNASGPRSAERGEIFELSAVHGGALVFKSCNIAGLDAPENLKNRGMEHFAAIAGDLVPRGKKVVGSIVGTTDDEFVTVAKKLDGAGTAILELNFADDYVANSLAPFASLEKLKSVIGRVRDSVRCVLAVKVSPKSSFEPRALADLLKSAGVAIAVCQNDLPKDLEIDIKSGVAKGKPRALSLAHTMYRESGGALDIVAVGGINTGRDAYVAHLTGAKGLQVGSALIKEGAGALGRIDRELDTLLAEHGKKSVNDIVGKVAFSES